MFISIFIARYQLLQISLKLKLVLTIDEAFTALVFSCRFDLFQLDLNVEYSGFQESVFFLLWENCDVIHPLENKRERLGVVSTPVLGRRMPYMQ